MATNFYVSDEGDQITLDSLGAWRVWRNVHSHLPTEVMTVDGVWVPSAGPAAFRSPSTDHGSREAAFAAWERSKAGAE